MIAKRSLVNLRVGRLARENLCSRRKSDLDVPFFPIVDHVRLCLSRNRFSSVSSLPRFFAEARTSFNSVAPRISVQ